MVEQSKKTHTRIIYALAATLLTFGYFYFIDPQYHAGGWNFLMMVAGGLGLSKATEHLKLK